MCTFWLNSRVLFYSTTKNTASICFWFTLFLMIFLVFLQMRREKNQMFQLDFCFVSDEIRWKFPIEIGKEKKNTTENSLLWAQRFPNSFAGWNVMLERIWPERVCYSSMQIVIWRVNQTATGKNVENELASEKLKRNASATYTVHAHMAKWKWNWNWNCCHICLPYITYTRHSFYATVFLANRINCWFDVDDVWIFGTFCFDYLR